MATRNPLAIQYSNNFISSVLPSVINLHHAFQISAILLFDILQSINSSLLSHNAARPIGTIVRKYLSGHGLGLCGLLDRSGGGGGGFGHVRVGQRAQ